MRLSDVVVGSNVSLGDVEVDSDVPQVVSPLPLDVVDDVAVCSNRTSNIIHGTGARAGAGAVIGFYSFMGSAVFESVRIFF